MGKDFLVSNGDWFLLFCQDDKVTSWGKVTHCSTRDFCLNISSWFVLGVESLPIFLCAESTCNQQQVWGQFVKRCFLSEVFLKILWEDLCSYKQRQIFKRLQGFKVFLRAGFKPEQEVDFLPPFFFKKTPIWIFHFSTILVTISPSFSLCMKKIWLRGLEVFVTKSLDISLCGKTKYGTGAWMF